MITLIYNETPFQVLPYPLYILNHIKTEGSKNTSKIILM